MMNMIRFAVSLVLAPLVLLCMMPGAVKAQEADSTVYNRLTMIDPELLQYFPRWYVCEPDLQAKIYNAFRVLGYRKENLSQQSIRVTAQPTANEEDPFEILIVECGTERMTSQDMSSTIPNIQNRLAERKRSYCYIEVPRTAAPTVAQTEAITSFLKPTSASHSFMLSAFEQNLKIGKSGFWLSNILGTDQVGYHFWYAGEAKVLLQRPLYVNEDVRTRRAIPYLIDAKLGFGYRISSDPTDGGFLDFIPSRKLDAGPGGKFVGGIDFHLPIHPEVGISVNMELPLQPVTPNTGIDPKSFALYDIGNRSIIANGSFPADPFATVYLLRSTGQATVFYNWWMNPENPENFFRFDAGISYAEVREAAVIADTLENKTFLAISGIRGLRTYKPNEVGDWVYLRAEYRNQKTFPFGLSMQYSNQILLAHAYVPLFGQWLYIEGKYAQPLRGVRPFEKEHLFMISPVLRLTF